jgi:hypothetical protein
VHVKLFAKLSALLFAVSAVSYAATGCAVPDKTHLPGSLFFDVGHEGWVVAHDGKVSSTKSGKGTQSSILGVINGGDSSIEAARKDGDINKISHIDYHGSHILGIIGDQTLIVYGE